MHALRIHAATLSALALAASLSAAALATSEPEETPISVDIIEGVTWLLTSQAVDGELASVPGGVVVSLLMTDGQAGGTAGCNGYFAEYELDGQALTFGTIGSTQMACVGPVMDLEVAYLANLASVASYGATGGPLVMLDAAGATVLEFEMAPEVTIVGSWVATGINNQVDGVVSSESTASVTAAFGADGQLTGFDGCNDYFTGYAVDGETIAIDPAIGQTRMACPSEELDQQAQWYIAAIANASTWTVDASGALELRDGEGALQVRYAPAD